ncbi:MAG: O-antigen ligase family protein [Bacteroidota bacterium]|jgi:hypothetical protein
MFRSILEYKTPTLVLILHIAIGLGSLLTSWVSILWFYFILLSNFGLLVQNQKPFYAIALVTYLTSFEILFRMVYATPYVPYEVGKYLLVGAFTIMIFTISGRSVIGWLMLVCILPALFYDYSGEVGFANLVFNAFGLVALALGVITCSTISITLRELKTLLRLLVFPLISCLTFIYIRTPDYEDITFDLGANFETTGGFGSNQVSTILGLGCAIVFICIILKWQLTIVRWIDVGIFFLFGFQGLLTFSRGGVIGAVVAIVSFIYIISLSSDYIKKKYKVPNFLNYLIPLIFLGFFAFEIANDITGGNLKLRYQGETAGTLVGAKEKDLNALTSNRYNIFKEDLEVWQEFPITGVGVGASRYMRNITEGIIAHVELSRMLSEHGILGMFYFLLLIAVYFIYVNTTQQPVFKAIMTALFVLALYSTFHAATRTYVTPMLVSISVLRFKPDATDTKPVNEQAVPVHQLH